MKHIKGTCCDEHQYFNLFFAIFFLDLPVKKQKTPH
jgi:hypothetical protein